MTLFAANAWLRAKLLAVAQNFSPCAHCYGLCPRMVGE